MLTEKEFHSKWDSIVPTLKNFILRLTYHNTEDTKDYIQDTFLKAYKKRDSYRPEMLFKTWIFNIAKNRFLDDYRKKKVRKHISHSLDCDFLDNREVANSIADQITYKINRSDTNHAMDIFMSDDYELAINQIDEKYRLPFEMYEKGFHYNEISIQLKTPIGTIKNYIFIARRELKLYLSDYDRRMEA